MTDEPEEKGEDALVVGEGLLAAADEAIDHGNAEKAQSILQEFREWLKNQSSILTQGQQSLKADAEAMRAEAEAMRAEIATMKATQENLQAAQSTPPQPSKSQPPILPEATAAEATAAEVTPPQTPHSDTSQTESRESAGNPAGKAEPQARGKRKAL
jgi:hypothetical protein